MVGARPVQVSAADIGGMKAGDYIIAVNGLNKEGRTAFDSIDQISNNPNSLFVIMTIRTTASGTNRDAPSSSNDNVVFNVTTRREFQAVKDPIMYCVSKRINDGTVVEYMRVLEFNSLVEPRLEDAIRTLQEGCSSPR